ncbi:oligosaccharide flippase family protein [Brucella sp. IR073]|uniref:oligosaccharide flippase family protein n=1 Tax=unclassified Brucella TaxID=2632610 RepID=UPI003B9814F3
MSWGVKNILPRQRLLRDLSTLSGAAALAQIIALAVLPVLTRLYPPEAHGLAATFASIVGIIGVVSSLRYEFAIPLPRTDRGAWHLAALSLALLIAVSVVSGVAALWLGGEMARALDIPVWVFAALVAVGIATLSAYKVANYWAVRKSAFGTIARTRIQQGIAGPGSQLALGLMGIGPLALVIGQIIGQCAGLSRLAIQMIADNRRRGLAVRRRGIAWAAKRYRKFPLYDSWAGLLDIAGAQAPILLLATLFSPIVAGYYTLANRVFTAPLRLVGTALSQVLQPRIVEAQRTGTTAKLLEGLIQLLTVMALPPFAIAAVIIPDFVSTLFGKEWADAGWVVAWTATWAGSQFVAAPLGVVLIAVEAQKLNMALQASLVAVRVAALLVGAALGSAYIAIVLFSVVSAIGYMAITAASGILVGLTMNRMVVAVWRPVLLASFGASIVALIRPEFSAVRYFLVILIGGLWGWQMWASASRFLRQG